MNKAVIDFETFYVNDCQGFQYFQDKADGSEYVYTELEPDYCHIVFPCFDQPDLKAPHKTVILAPADWEVISNSLKMPVAYLETVVTRAPCCAQRVHEQFVCQDPDSMSHRSSR